MSYAFTAEYLYSKTDNGLEILKYFLQSCKGFDKALHNQKEAFFFRGEEKTASAYLIPPDKQIKSKVDYWRMKDHGDEFYTPIKLAQYYTGLDFYPCLKYLYEIFNLTEGKSFFQAEIEAKTLDEKDERQTGWFNIAYKKKADKIDVIGRFVTEEIAEKYYCKQVDYYEKVFVSKKTNLKTYIKVTSTDSYPIFAYQEQKEWAKLYCPLSSDKQYKHQYLGKKPERYIHGWTNLFSEVDKDEIDLINKNIDYYIKSNADKKTIDEAIAERNDLMIKEVFICSGGSDGMNVASLGKAAIWFNSESEQIEYKEFEELKKYVLNIYNLPDVDKPGLKYAYALAEKFWNLKTIYLPKNKLGNNGKDFRDWMRFYHNANIETVIHQFSLLQNGALKCKFFEYAGKSLKIQPSYLHYFLKVKGFHLYYPEKEFTDRSSEQEFIFIRIVDNIVYQYYPNQIRKFCEKYLIEKGENIKVIDLIKSTTQFTDKNLLSLDNCEIDTKNYSHSGQSFFFKNVFCHVTADDIVLKPYKEYDKLVWSENIIKHNIIKTNSFFEHYVDEKGNNRVNIINHESQFSNYLINGSRVFWRKEIEENIKDEDARKEYLQKNKFTLKGKGLTDEEIIIQEQHYLSKIYAIGYILHRQKRESFAKAVYITDDLEKDSEVDANGGSGKSLFVSGLEKLTPKKFKLDGKNKNIVSDKHVLHGLTKEAGFIYIEDLDAYISLDMFYNWITSSVVVNPKQLKPYEIGFFDVAKVVINSNFGLSKIVASTLRRLFFVSFSDWYHTKTDNYNEERKVSDDFDGNDLFGSTWNEKDFNNHYNFLLQCLQFYLKNYNNEIAAPRTNIDINNAKAAMGDVFIDWCNSYFQESQTIKEKKEILENGKMLEIQEEIIIPGTLNQYIQRSVMQDDYAKVAGNYKKTAPNFKKSLQLYCKSKGYIFNPKELCGSDGKIKQAIKDHSDKRQIVEHFFIKTNNYTEQENEQNNNQDDDDKLPF